MKKLYFLLLAAILASGMGFSASAYTITFTCDAMEHLLFASDLNKTPLVDGLETVDATTVKFTSTTNKRIYIFEKDGYFITSAKQGNYTRTANTNAAGDRYLNLWNTSSSGDVTIEAIVIDRSESITINVINGLSTLTATYTSLATRPLELTNGKNIIPIDPRVDKTLQISSSQRNSSNGTDIYSLKLNGEAQTLPFAFRTYYELSPVANDVIDVQVFEGGEQKTDAEVTFSLPAGFEKAITYIRDHSANKYLYQAATDGALPEKMTMAIGHEIRLTFDIDYTITGAKIGDTDFMDSYNAEYNSFSFKVPEDDATLAIEGKIREWGTVTYKINIDGAEGVELREGTMDGKLIQLPEGTPATTQKLGSTYGYTFNGTTGKSYSVGVSEKDPRIWFTPKEGWYIATAEAYDTDAKGYVAIGQINANSKESYIIARKYVIDSHITFDVIGTGRAKLSTGHEEFTGNPERDYTLKADAKTTIDFCADMEAPFHISSGDGETYANVYYDGKTVDITSKDQISYHVIKAPKGDYTPVVTIDTENALSTSTFSCTGDGAATITYSDNKHAYTSGTYMATTPFQVKPSFASFTATLNGKAIKPAEDGTFTFALADGSNTLAITEIKPFAIETEPAHKSTVKKISAINVLIPFDENINPYADEESLKGVTLTSPSGKTHTVSLGEGGMSDDETKLKFPLLLAEPATEAGDYTLTIPAGTFYNTEWNDATEAMERVPFGAASAAHSATITVDPTLKSDLDYYTLIPADGSAVRSIATAYLQFEKLSATTLGVSFAQPAGTVTDGTKTYNVFAGHNDENPSLYSVALRFMDSNWEDAVLEGSATWTLKLNEGAIKYGDLESEAIEATFTTGEDLPAYIITPAPGTTISDLTKFTVTFPNIFEITENEALAVTLTDPEGVKTSATEIKLPQYAGYAEIYFPASAYANGEYTLTIPAGKFSLEGTDTEATTAKYTYKSIYALTPAAGSAIEATEFTIEFPFATSAEYVGGNFALSISNGANGTYAAFLDCTPVEGAEHPTFKLSPREGAQAAPFGSIQIVIEGGAFLLDGDAASPEISAWYTLEGKVSTEYTIDPTSGIIMAEGGFGTWTVAFNESTTVAFAAGHSESDIAATFNDEPIELMAMIENCYLMMGSASLNGEGTIKVTIPAGTLTLSGEEVKDVIEFTLEVREPKEFAYGLDPDPAAGTAKWIGEIIVTFPNATDAEYTGRTIQIKQGYSVVSQKATVEKLGGIATFAADADAAEATAPSFKITFADAPITKGTYKLQIPAGAFLLDGFQESNAIDETYDVDVPTGIEGIILDGTETLTIYTLQGIRITTEWSKLPAGIYIVNGRKIAKK